MKVRWRQGVDFFKGLWDIVTTWFSRAWDSIKTTASNAWQWIVTVWNNAAGWFTANVTNPIRNAFTGMRDWFSGVLDSISVKFWEVFNGVQGVVLTAINNILGFIDTMRQRFLEALNPIANFFGISTPAPSAGSTGSRAVSQGRTLPRLATGAVIPPNAQFAAILGDQKSGKNIEAPVDLMRQTFEESLVKALANQNVTINFTGTGAGIARLLKPELDRENTRIGTSLVRGS